MKTHIVKITSVSNTEELRQAIQSVVSETLESGHEVPDDMEALVSHHIYTELMKEVHCNGAVMPIYSMPPNGDLPPRLRFFNFTIDYNDSLPDDMVVICDMKFMETLKILTSRVIEREVESRTLQFKLELVRRLQV